MDPKKKSAAKSKLKIYWNFEDPSFEWKKKLEPTAWDISFWIFVVVSNFTIFPYKCCYFSHFYLFLPNFLPIGILMRFLVWRLSGPFKTIFRPKKSKKKLLKIFLTTLLYENLPLWQRLPFEFGKFLSVLTICICSQRQLINLANKFEENINTCAKQKTNRFHKSNSCSKKND